jgi:dTMP kinase
VVLDRFLLSTYAYQIHGRGLSEDAVRSANRLATAGIVPDLTLLLRLDPAVGLGRAGARGGADRIERAEAAFHARVATAFDLFGTPAWQAAHPECGRVVAVDAAGTEDDVAARVWAEVETHCPPLVAAGAAR